MYCGNCGNECSNGIKFCTKCGMKLENSQNSATVSFDNSEVPMNNMPIFDTHIPDTDAKAKKKKRISIAAIIAIVVCVCVVAGVVLFVYNSGVSYEKQIELGYALLDDGKYEEAIIEFDKAIAIDKKKPDAYYGKATSMAHSDNMDDSLAEDIIDVLKEGYKQSGDIGLIDYKEDIADIIEGNGYEEEAEKVRKEVTADENSAGDGFTYGSYVVDVNNMVVRADKDGFYLYNKDTEEEKFLSVGTYSVNFVTDGNVIYYVDIKDGLLKSVDAQSNIESIVKLYPNEEEIKQNDFYQQNTEYYQQNVEYTGHEFDSSIDGYCDGYIYVTEWYGAGWGNTYYCNLKTKDYKIMPGEYISQIKSYDGRIYYTHGMIEGDLYEIYSSKPDGTDEQLIDINGDASFMNIHDGVLYYRQGGSEDIYEEGNIIKLDLSSMDKKVIYTLGEDDYYRGSTKFGIVISTSENDIILDFDGDEIGTYESLGGCRVYSEGIVITKYRQYDNGDDDNYTYVVVTEKESSKPIVAKHMCVGYADNKLYLQDDDTDMTDATLVIYTEDVVFKD